jgi:hypothetical protein
MLALSKFDTSIQKDEIESRNKKEIELNIENTKLESELKVKNLYKKNKYREINRNREK